MSTLTHRLHRSGPFIVARTFVTRPKIAWRAFVVRPVVSRVACSRVGHVQEENVSRILDSCDRCGTWGITRSREAGA